MGLPEAEAWIDLMLKRGPELRKAGFLSIGSGGHSAVLAPAEPGADDTADRNANSAASSDGDEPSDAWENPTSYPSGHVPSYGDIDPVDKLPPIPSFGDD